MFSFFQDFFHRSLTSPHKKIQCETGARFPGRELMNEASSVIAHEETALSVFLSVRLREFMFLTQQVKLLMVKKSIVLFEYK